VKGLLAFWTKAKYGKMSIDGRDPVNTETPHYSEAGTVDEGKILALVRDEPLRWHKFLGHFQSSDALRWV
jgi:hypothetical protein